MGSGTFGASSSLVHLCAPQMRLSQIFAKCSAICTTAQHRSEPIYKSQLVQHWCLCTSLCKKGGFRQSPRACPVAAAQPCSAASQGSELSSAGGSGTAGATRAPHSPVQQRVLPSDILESREERLQLGSHPAMWVEKCTTQVLSC